MRGAHSTTMALALLTGSLWTVPAPAAADWLVTRDGSKVETQGAWKVQGKRIVFTAKDGTLASLRLTEVDLDASRQATSAAAQATEERAVQATPAPPKKSVRVLTDKDFAKPAPVPPASAADPADPAMAPVAAAGDAAPPSSSALQVASWKQERDAQRDLMKISGIVRNNGPDLATAVQVTIRLYEEGGRLLATQQAALDTRTLKPGQDTSFQAEIPAVNGFASAQFDVRSIPLVRRPEGEQPGERPPG